ncbi:MAG: ATP-binding protein [Bacteroidetes bacterium]|nr:ATP-binding protein [Bacteroidota bacterium]
MKNCQIQVKNVITELENISGKLENFWETHSLPARSLFETNLVVEELFTNIVFYGYTDQAEHHIMIDLCVVDSELIIKIEDDAIAFNPLEKEVGDELVKPVEDRQIGGLGIHLVKTLMDKAEYLRKDGRNILTLHKNL